MMNRLMRINQLSLFGIALCLMLSASQFIFVSGAKSVSFESTADLPAWALTWSDEFDGANGSGVDPQKWIMETGGNGWGNNELEYYTNRTQNAYLENGSLVIKAIKEDYTGPDFVARSYTSARLKTQNKFTQTYGRFEARIKVPYGQGIWPAFWMLGSDINQVGWPRCGEIDIMENIGKEPSTVHGTIHGPGYSGGSGIGAAYSLTNNQRFADDYHIYAVEWEPKAMRWYVDGNLFKTITTKDLPAGTEWVFNHPFFMLLNLAVGGNWPGYPDNTTVFPQVMLVDYVRVYQPKIASTSAASYTGSTVAVESISSVFGNNLAAVTQSGETNPLPTEIAGVSVKITDKSSTERFAPLFFVSPVQINFQIPPGTLPGAATVTITNPDGAVSLGTADIATVSPGLFAANSTGQGIAAALALRIKPNGSQNYEYAFQYDPVRNNFTAIPIDLGPESDEVILVLFGTGIRYRADLSSVTVKLGGSDAQTLFAGPQGDYIGLDQINVRLSRSLIGRGELDVVVSVNGLAANILKVNVK